MTTLQQVSEGDLTVFRGRFAGRILTPADGAEYDTARTVFNGMFDRRPAVIARATTTADVAAALDFAQRAGLPIAVRGGGHSVAGYSTIDDGLVIDLGLMKGIEIDPDARRARVEGGVVWGEFDTAAQQHGLATTGGRMTTTGVAGFTLGSGSGWLERLHGFASDNLLSAEVVLAEGNVVTASRETNAELFWGLCGGGGNFGIVTSFEFQLHPVGPMIYAGLVFYPRDKAPEVCRNMRDFLQEAPSEVCGGALLMSFPPAPFVPPELVGKPAVAVLTAYFGDPAEGPAVLAPVREFGQPSVDLYQEMPYLQLQAITDAGNPPGRRNYWRSDALGELPDDALDAFIACAATTPAPASVLILSRVGGAIDDLPEDASSVTGRGQPWMYHCYGIWTDPKDDAAGIEWARGTEEAMRPWSTTSVALNFVSDVDDKRVRDTYGEEKLRRLVALKDRYDPGNVFRMNQNVKPTQA
jgi:FAD/FMN-containing dehydrogenase